MEDQNISIIKQSNNHSNFHSFPISIFRNSPLSGLEAITKYLKEELFLSFREIGQLTSRDERTIWGAYTNSKQKMPSSFNLEFSNYSIPLYIIKDRNVSILEAVTEYLKEQFGLRYCQIAPLINRNDRTVWTVYQRAKKKRKQNA